MKMPPFELFSPTTLEEALSKASELRDSGEEFDWVAGGTDLLPNYKWHINVKKNVISLARIEDLATLSETHIGAMVRVHELANSEVTHSVLAKAAKSIASVMIRRSGTVGGNICLDTRCYWINQSETIHCSRSIKAQSADLDQSIDLIHRSIWINQFGLDQSRFNLSIWIK